MKQENSNTLSVHEILEYLPADLKALLSDRVFLYESLKSTNMTAKEMVISGAGHEAVVIADSQTAGKGRGGKAFHSPPGHGLYISFILEII